VDHPIAADTQRQHSPAVLTNRLRLEHRWGQPCLAYHVCIRPGPAAAAALACSARHAFTVRPATPGVAAEIHLQCPWHAPAAPRTVESYPVADGKPVTWPNKCPNMGELLPFRLCPQRHTDLPE
jgi:hypothetical protein